ncbi:hypothetical protein KP509_32G071700 [Ceratopteris richardii]|uniref:Uncharacterized protein n=1 Tax=Ceratopteris richardii TaxID=49495 RepID=A0A8T2QWL7_CERRI|nr:hypothetical protein KP509_32G071700 [Ceratopteris richardii]
MYKMAPESGYCHIPFRIDTRAEGDSEGYLKGGVHFVDGDEIVRVHCSGFMCAKLNGSIYQVCVLILFNAADHMA